MLQYSAVLGELLQDVRGTSGWKTKHSDPTIMVVIFTSQLLSAVRTIDHNMYNEGLVHYDSLTSNIITGSCSPPSKRLG